MDTDSHLKELVFAVLAEREKTLNLTAKGLEYRLEHLNALRDQVMQDRDTFMLKTVYDEAHSALVGRVTRLETNFAKAVGVGAALVATSAVVGLIIGHYWK